MARNRSSALTERESQIMQILWEQGSASANEVREALERYRMFSPNEIRQMLAAL